MSYNEKDELDVLFERALEDSVSDEVLPDRVWANIQLRMQERRQRPRTRFEYLRHLGVEVMAWGSEIGTTAMIILASLYIRSNGEGWTERLVLSGHSTVSPNYSINH